MKLSLILISLVLPVLLQASTIKELKDKLSYSQPTPEEKLELLLEIAQLELIHPKEQLYYAQQALQQASFLLNLPKQRLSHTLIGHAHHSAKREAEALEHYMIGLSIAEDMEDASMITASNAYIAILLYESRGLEQARSYFQAAINTKGSNVSTRIDALVCYTTALNEEDHLSTEDELLADALISELMEITENDKHMLGRVRALLARAERNESKGANDLAIIDLEVATRMLTEANPRYYYDFTRLRLAVALYNSEEPPSITRSIQISEDVLEQAVEHDYMDLQSTAHHLLSESYEKTAQHEQALHHLQEYLKLTELERQEAQHIQPSEMEAIRSAHSKKLTIAATARKESASLQIWISIILLLIALIVWSTLMGTSRRTKEKFGRLDIGVPDWRTNTGIDKDAVTHAMNGQDAKMSTQLTRKFPNLSTKEQLVCRLICVGLASKEIADYLNLSTRSIDTYRSRIRKKMGLSPNQKFDAAFKDAFA